MGKASSAKKVARAARAGGAKRAQRRPAMFPLAIALIVVLGVGLIAFARTSSDVSVDAENPPQPEADHWHAAYGVFLCDYFNEAVVDKGADANGIHTHGDSLVHIHPFTQAVAGKNATLGVFFDQTGLRVNDERIELPDGRVFKEGETTCNGEPGEVRVVHWNDARTALSAEEPDDVFTEDLSSIRFTEDLGAYTIAFVPEGTDVPPPPEAERICEDAVQDGAVEACASGAGEEAGAPTGEPGATTVPPSGSSVPATGSTEPAPDTSAPSGSSAPAPSDSAPATEPPATVSE